DVGSADDHHFGQRHGVTASSARGRENRGVSCYHGAGKGVRLGWAGASFYWSGPKTDNVSSGEDGGMVGRVERVADGFTLLDGAALVTGAAVASVHIREAIADGHLLGPGWALAWLSFAGIALTAAGPFVFLLRRLGRRPPGYPRIGDRLWALLGGPW